MPHFGNFQLETLVLAASGVPTQFSWGPRSSNDCISIGSQPATALLYGCLSPLGQGGQQCCLLGSSGSVPGKDVVCAAASLTGVTHGSQQSKENLRGGLGWEGVRLTRVK